MFTGDENDPLDLINSQGVRDPKLIVPPCDLPKDLANGTRWIPIVASRMTIQLANHLLLHGQFPPGYVGGRRGNVRHVSYICPENVYRVAELCIKFRQSPHIGTAIASNHELALSALRTTAIMDHQRNYEVAMLKPFAHYCLEIENTFRSSMPLLDHDILVTIAECEKESNKKSVERIEKVGSRSGAKKIEVAPLPKLPPPSPPSRPAPVPPSRQVNKKKGKSVVSVVVKNNNAREQHIVTGVPTFICKYTEDEKNTDDSQNSGNGKILVDDDWDKTFDRALECIFTRDRCHSTQKAIIEF
jgi:hypothetical protein